MKNYKLPQNDLNFNNLNIDSTWLIINSEPSVAYHYIQFNDNKIFDARRYNDRRYKSSDKDLSIPFDFKNEPSKPNLDWYVDAWKRNHWFKSFRVPDNNFGLKIISIGIHYNLIYVTHQSGRIVRIASDGIAVEGCM